MPANLQIERKSIELLAFEHYLRTGRRVDVNELVAAVERKFNHNHDQIGRFTFSAGAVASGGHVRAGHSPVSHRRNTATQSAPTSQRGSSDIFRSTYVRNAVSPTTSNADTYFELNKRQAYLNHLRSNAGANPAPVIKADLDEFQRRLDANRELLNERYKIADQNVNEIMRAGLAPVDIAEGAVNVASGKGELRDYLAVASVVPVGGVIGKVGKFVRVGKAGKLATEGVGVAKQEILQLGGPHSAVRKIKGYHSHHLVADSVSPLSRGKGPAIAMLPAHHVETASYGSKKAAEVFRQQQRALAGKGDFKGALQMGVDDVRQKFGDLYDSAIKQSLTYSRKEGH